MSTYDFCNIDYNAHYFIPLEVAEFIIPWLGPSGMAVYSPDNCVLVECTISKGMYDKILAVPVKDESNENIYTPKNYYKSDFVEHLNKGIIIKKETKTQHVELVNEWEPLTANTYLVHSRYVVAE